MSQSTQSPPGTHPVMACAAELAAALESVCDVDPMFMTAEQKAAALTELPRLVDRTQALLMRVMAAAGDVADRDGSPNVASWLAPRVRADHRPLHHTEQLAKALEARWLHVAAGLAEGRVSLAQAQVIVRALEALEDDVDADLLARCEQHLVEQAAHFTPAELRRLGMRVLEVVCPDAFEDEERKKLERAEKRAAAQTRLHLRNRGDGTVDLHARIPEGAASRLRGYLEAFTSPRHDAMAGHPHLDPATGKRLPFERVRGEAFCALLERLDPATLPARAGAPTRVVVTISLTDLMAGTGVATLADGTPITAGQARRLACNAGLVPAVLGGASEVLDLGRERRLFTGAQKLAMTTSHPTCRAQGCTVPATWCEAHHARDPWSRGGQTDLADGQLLCPWHHHRAHDPNYRTDQLPNGDVRYHKRR